MSNNYSKDEDLQIYEKPFNVKKQERDNKKLICNGMLEVDPNIWIPIQCVMIPIRETELAIQCTITVNHVDDDRIDEIYGDCIGWIPKVKINSCYWICINIFNHQLKVSNRRFTNV